MSRKRKVCVVIASRANYARIKYFMKAVQESDKLELQIVLGASALLYKFGRVIDVLQEDGFKPAWKIYYLIEGENLSTQAKSTGMGIIELSTAFQELAPDIVVTVADRYETMATAIAASYLNIPLAHIQGGEVSGNIDDSVRHAITKLAHLHFPCTEQSAQRVLKMGEEPWRVLMSGCPSIDILNHMSSSLPPKEFFESKGTGVPLDPAKPYLLVLQHPETTTYGDGARQIRETLSAVREVDMAKIILWPNADAGSDDVAKEIREFRDQNLGQPFSYYINFTPEVFAQLLAHAKCLVGNSSSFIREGSFLGTPAVIVGTRQEGREHGANVIYADYDKQDILKKIHMKLAHGRYPSETIFGDGHAGKKIMRHLETARLDIRKRFVD